jgi:hypothetical protein
MQLSCGLSHKHIILTCVSLILRCVFLMLFPFAELFLLFSTVSRSQIQGNDWGKGLSLGHYSLWRIPWFALLVSAIHQQPVDWVFKRQIRSEECSSVKYGEEHASYLNAPSNSHGS